eukprot:jgi/Hompol1/693/HPOL_000814-RA
MVVSHRTILLPTDFSPCSVRAMEWACEHVIREGDKVILLNAVQNVPLAIDPDVVDLRIQDLFIGAAINVHARQLTIRDYGDQYSRRKLVKQMENTLLLIKPDAYWSMGKIIDAVIAHDFSICRVHMLQASQDLASNLLGDSASPDAVQSLVGGLSLAIELLKPNAIQELAQLAGPENVDNAKSTAPKSLRALFGSSGFKNAVHVPLNHTEAQHQLALIFGNDSRRSPRTATLKNCTLGIIRPHAVNTGLTGKVIQMIQNGGYNITDMELFHLDRANGEDFLEVYKGVSMLDQMTAGPLIAMEISGDADVATRFREFTGPTDPEIAKQLRPDSIRAKYGVDKVRNTLHCTDLPEDGVLEAKSCRSELE